MDDASTSGKILGLLGNPVRLQMLTYLIDAEKPVTINRLFKSLDSKTARSWYHLGKLRAAHLVEAERTDERTLMLKVNTELLQEAFTSVSRALKLDQRKE